jgi:hypothetical protein
MFDDSGLLFELVSALTLLIRLFIGAGFIAISARLWRQTRIRGSAEMTIGFCAILVLSIVSLVLPNRLISDDWSVQTGFWVMLYTIAALNLCAQLLAFYGASRLVAHLIRLSKSVPSVV